MPVGVDFGQHLPEQDDQKGDAKDVKGGSDPPWQSGQPMLHQHRRQQDDEDVDGVVQAEDGRQQLSGPFVRVRGVDQGEGGLGAVVILGSQRGAVVGIQ